MLNKSEASEKEKGVNQGNGAEMGQKPFGHGVFYMPNTGRSPCPRDKFTPSKGP